MRMENHDQLNAKVKEWWNDHPFVYRMDRKAAKPADKKTFETIDKKFIKWTPWGQRDSTPLSGVIDYPRLKGKRVLDIAIGTGWSTVEFVRAGAVVSGIDLTPNAIDLTKKRFGLFGVSVPDLRVADAQELPFEDNSFDYVLAWGCLMHMPDTQKAIDEIRRVLKPGGKTAAMMYNKHSLHWWYYIVFSKGILRGKLLYMSFQELANRYTDGEYLGGNQLTKFYSKSEIKLMFKAFSSCGVSVRDTTTAINRFPHRNIAVGKFLPRRLRQYLTTVVGQSLWIESRK